MGKNVMDINKRVLEMVKESHSLGKKRMILRQQLNQVESQMLSLDSELDILLKIQEGEEKEGQDARCDHKHG